MADWDADDYVPPEPSTVAVPKAAAINLNKWEGEDEEEDVKDNWEDEDNEEEKKDSEKPPDAPKSAASKKPKKNLEAKIQEKERILQEEKERARQPPNLTPAELAAEKLRQRKLQEESELELVKATYGDDTSSGTIDNANPSTKEEFDQLREAISNKVEEFSKEEPYVEFVTELVKNMVVNLPATDLKSLSSYLTSLASEKSKMDKATSKKKGGKFKGAKLKMDDRDLTSELHYDDLDDFM